MTNGAAVFECDATGYANPAQYCCETGPYQKTSCCSNQALRFNLGSGTPTGVQIVLGGDGGGGGGGLSTSASTPVPLPPSPTSPSSTHSAMKSAVISQPIATTTLIMSVTPPISQQPTTSSSEVGSGSHDTLQSPTSSTKSTSKTSPTLTFSKNPSTTDNGQNSNNSSSQAEGAAQTSLGTSSNVTPINTGISEAAKVAIGVAVPVAILLAALLGFLLWNNHRNSKRIRSLQSDLSTSRSPKPPLIDIIPPASCPSVHSFPTALMAEIDAGGRLATTKTFPGYPRYEYYKPQPQLRPMHEMGGDSNPQELPIWTRRPHELDSTPMISHHPQGFS